MCVPPQNTQCKMEIHSHTHTTTDTAATDRFLQKRPHTSYTLVKRKWDGFTKMDGMWQVWWRRVELSEMTHMADTDRTDGRRPVPDSDALNVHVC